MTNPDDLGTPALRLEREGSARVDAHRFYERQKPELRAMCFGWLL